MSERKRVLVSMGTAEPTDEFTTAGLRTKYLERLAENDLTTLLVHPAMGTPAIMDLYYQSSGVVFTGGQDIGVDVARDTMERGILLFALTDNRPVLGICKGTQILGESSGADIRDLSTEIINHGNGQLGYRDSIVNQHEITIDPTSRTGIIFAHAPVLRIPSNHHQAIDPNYTGVLRVVGIAPDRVVEVVERTDQDFCIGVQGHPEVSQEWAPLFAAFAQAVREFGEYNASGESPAFAPREARASAGKGGEKHGRN